MGEETEPIIPFSAQLPIRIGDSLQTVQKLCRTSLLCGYRVAILTQSQQPEKSHLAEDFSALRSLTWDDVASNIWMDRSMVPCNMAVSRLDGVSTTDKDATAIARSVPTNSARDNKGLVVAVLIIIDAATLTRCHVLSNGAAN